MKSTYYEPIYFPGMRKTITMEHIVAIEWYVQTLEDIETRLTANQQAQPLSKRALARFTDITTLMHEIYTREDLKVLLENFLGPLNTVDLFQLLERGRKPTDAE